MAFTLVTYNINTKVICTCITKVTRGGQKYRNAFITNAYAQIKVSNVSELIQQTGAAV